MVSDKTPGIPSTSPQTNRLNRLKNRSIGFGFPRNGAYSSASSLSFTIDVTSKTTDLGTHTTIFSFTFAIHGNSRKKTLAYFQKFDIINFVVKPLAEMAQLVERRIRNA